MVQFAEDLHLTMPVLLDRDGSMSKSYGVRGLPTWILIDPEGLIREIRAGEINRVYIETQLAALGVLAALDLTTPTPTLPHRESTATPGLTTLTPTLPHRESAAAPGLTTPMPAASTPVSGLERVDLNEIFPPDEGQDLVIKTCLVCHEVFTFGVARKTEVEWLRNEANHVQEFTQLAGEMRPNDAQIVAMYKYMVANFNRDRPISKQVPPSFVCGV